MQKGFGLIPVVIILVIGLVVGGFLLDIKYQKKSVETMIVSSPTPVSGASVVVPASASPSVSIDETTKWKVFEGESYNISYPSNWLLDTSGYRGKDFVILSSDYKEEQSERGGVAKGTIIYLIVDGQTLSNQLHNLTIDQRRVDWLGKQVILKTFEYGGFITELNSQFKNHTYTLIMVSMEDALVRQENQSLFLKIANTLIIN